VAFYKDSIARASTFSDRAISARRDFYSLRNFSPPRFALKSLRHLDIVMSKLARRGASCNYVQHPFDLRNGLDTGGYISARDLVTGHAHDAYVTGYSAVAPSVFRQICRRWIDTLASRSRVEAYSFIDVGAGKGRAVLLASEHPFRKIIGVELSKELAQIAGHNIEKWKKDRHTRAPMRIVHQDVTEFRWPRTPLLVYLYNPFERELIEELIDQLRRAAKVG
jgi:hypothetical protein